MTPYYDERVRRAVAAYDYPSPRSLEWEDVQVLAEAARLLGDAVLFTDEGDGVHIEGQNGDRYLVIPLEGETERVEGTE